MRSFSTYVAHDANQPDQITWNPLSNHESHKRSEHIINLTEVFKAYQLFSQTDIVEDTALIHSPRLSQEYEANIFLKREDHQRGRTFKIRGAYYQYLMADEKRRKDGFVIVSDGNFATSFAIISGLFKGTQ
jgi:threonine dehydratase